MGIVSIKLVELKGKRRFHEKIKDVLLRGRYINQLFTQLVMFEAAQLTTQSFVNKSYRDIFYGDLQTFIKSYVDDELKKIPSYPSKQVGELVMFFENRRGRSIEMVVVLLSAFLGGIAGSIITILIAS